MKIFFGIVLLFIYLCISIPHVILGLIRNGIDKIFERLLEYDG